MKHMLIDQLTEYCGSDAYPFHMPGHKRQVFLEEAGAPERVDITEITDFDNLHHAEGILQEGQERLAAVFGADESFYLVNGSTCGLLAAISGCLRKGERILVARNCHKAVYHGIYLMELQAEYLMPEMTDLGIQGSINPEQVRQQLEQHPDIKAVLITSPTYDGVVSDVAAISEIAHEHGIPLIVDEAHGAHFGFSAGFPQKAHTLGADLVVESVHKTLPSLTQTAVLHMKKQKSVEEKPDYYFNPERVKRYLGIYQTSSPSYVLMASIDRCVDMMEKQGAEPLAVLEKRLEAFYKDTADLKHLSVYPTGKAAGIWDREPSKILISCEKTGWSGVELLQILHDRYELELEMSAGHYVTALTSLMDTEEGFERLSQALHELDRDPCGCAATDAGEDWMEGWRELYQPGEICMSMAEVMDADGVTVPFAESVGRISCEFVYLYPPGIPVIAPGERIKGQTLRLLETCRQHGQEIEGLMDVSSQQIRVI